MKKEEKIFVDIMAQFMHPETNDIELIPLTTPEEWVNLYNISVIHHAIPIIYEGLKRNDFMEQIPNEVKSQWRASAIGEIIFQAKNTQNFLKLYNSLTECGVEALVVKGIVCRSLYLKPDYRVSRDEDLYIEKKDYETCNKFLKEHGFIRDDVDETDIPYEVSYFNREEGLNIELHTSLFDENSASYGHWNKAFSKAFKNKKEVEIDGEKILSLSDTDHLFFLICHAMKHFLHGGFGIRQLCDIIKMSEKYDSEINWQELINKTKKLNMYVFWMNLLDIAQNHLGFDWKNSSCPMPDSVMLDSEALLEDILCSGIYGKSSSGRIHSANITLGAAAKNKSMISSIIYSLFPDKKYMVKRYPYLKRYGILIPAAWAHRLFHYRKELKSNVDKSANNSIEIGKQRINLMKKYKIIN